METLGASSLGKLYDGDPFTTVPFVLLRCAIVSSSRLRCALTKAGGVRANHCGYQSCQHASRGLGYQRTHLLKTDILEAIFNVTKWSAGEFLRTRHIYSPDLKISRNRKGVLPVFST